MDAGSDFHGVAFDLSFGGGSTVVSPTPPSVSTTSATPASSLKSIDWQNYTYIDRSPKPRPGQVRQRHMVPTRNAGQIAQCGMRFLAVDYADVTGDGVDDAIVSLEGSTSGVIEGRASGQRCSRWVRAGR